jgi:four helix bundle protein
MRDVKNYDVFQLADGLVVEVYKATSGFPKEETYGLTSQLRRAAASIPSNLVEGAARSGEKEFGQFLNVAVGSCEEVRYQLHLANRLGYMDADSQSRLDAGYENVKMMLTKLLAAVGGKR